MRMTLGENGRRLARVTLLLSFLCAVGPLHAQEQQIWQMNHASWSSKNGAPRDVNALGQGSDGVLWLASERGLLTFDGLEFKAASVPSDVSGELRKPLWQLLVAKDGSVWFAPRVGGAVRLHGGEVTTFASVQANEPLRNLGSLQQDRHGTIWCVFNDQHPAFLNAEDKWQMIALPLANGEHVQAFLVDSSDTRWVFQNNRLYRQAAGKATFTQTSLQIRGPVSIREAPDRSVWIAGVPLKQELDADPLTILDRVSASGHLLQAVTLQGRLRTLLIDRTGSAWLAITGSGVRKVPITSQQRGQFQTLDESFGSQDGLTSNDQWCFFEDREGNVWVGGTRGVDRFTSATLVPAIRTQAVGVWSTCVDTNGEILVGGETGPLYRLNHDQEIEVKGARELNGLFCNGGPVWLLDAKGIARIEGQRLHRVPLLPGHSGFWDDYIFSTICWIDRHNLYAWATGANEDSLWIFDGKRWRRIAGTERFGRVISIATDLDGQVYLGRRDGKIDLTEGGRVDVLNVLNGGIDGVYGFARTTEGLTAFGRRGIAVKSGAGFETIQFAAALVSTRVTGVVQSKNGDFWVNSAAGINQVPREQIRRALRDNSYRVIANQVSRASEGAPLRLALAGGGSARMDRQGLLWFGTMDGIVSVDPTHLRTTPAPRLKIFDLLGDGRPIGSDGTFRPGLRTLRIEYLGVHLTDPNNVVYRYRLRGNDSDWQDVGSRREAVYTNLKPGSYRFEVIASNGFGTWTEPVQSATFRIRPYFWQTWWFLVISVVLGVWGLHLLYEQRLRTMRQRARMLAEERAEERTRIARELHDTLLQGIQGLLLNFEAVRQKLSHGGEVMDLLDRSLSATEALVIEGRERIATIRQENTYADALHRRLKALSTSLSGQSGVEIHFKSIGTVRDMYAVASEELYFIAREAIRNALKHSSATHVRLVLYYNQRLFRMECRDNGVGFDVSKELLQSDLRTKWGLQGMRERAESIRAQLSMTSDVGTGTLIEVRLDSKFAYVDDRNHQRL